MAKGIRVSQLAKELGVKSKDIIDKLAAESMLTSDGKKYAASSTVSVGLSMTIREWFAGAVGGEMAVETAEPVKAEVKKRVRKKKADDDTPEARGRVPARPPPPGSRLRAGARARQRPVFAYRYSPDGIGLAPSRFSRCLRRAGRYANPPCSGHCPSGAAWKNRVPRGHR